MHLYYLFVCWQLPGWLVWFGCYTVDGSVHPGLVWLYVCYTAVHCVILPLCILLCIQDRRVVSLHCLPPQFHWVTASSNALNRWKHRFFSARQPSSLCSADPTEASLSTISPPSSSPHSWCQYHLAGGLLIKSFPETRSRTLKLRSHLVAVDPDIAPPFIIGALCVDRVRHCECALSYQCLINCKLHCVKLTRTSMDVGTLRHVMIVMCRWVVAFLLVAFSKFRRIEVFIHCQGD